MQSNGGAIDKTINNIADRIKSLSSKVEGIQGKRPEFLVVLLYTVFRALMMIVHEPFFDEALAWLISRDSSLYDIMFTATHYEGHPSLWHILLMPFAKAGLSYEFSLSFVSMIFSVLAITIFVYKAPFKRIFRLVLPFTYYLFYQYSVVSRPYCLMILAFMLMAVTYRKKDEKPGRFVLSLWFLCITSAYGLIVAAGICIVWLIEMFSRARHESGNKSSDNGEYRGTFRIFIDSIFENGKAFWLLFLLAYALFIIWRIIPKDDVYAILESNGSSGLTERLLFTLFGGMSDMFVTNTFYQEGTLASNNIGILDLISSVLIGVGILAVIFRISRRKKKTLLFFVPYVMLAVSMAILYVARHHVGIILLFLIFWAWVYCEDNKIQSIQKVPATSGKLLQSLGILALTVGLIIPLYWNVFSSVMDVFTNYTVGREEYEYLKDNNLLGESILAEWSPMPSSSETITFSGPVVYLSPYLDEDLFLNSPNKLGLGFAQIHRVPSKEVTQALKDRIKKEGLPKVIIGNPDYASIYGSGILDWNDYECAAVIEGGSIWKGVPQTGTEKIYVRK